MKLIRNLERDSTTKVGYQNSDYKYCTGLTESFQGNSHGVSQCQCGDSGTEEEETVFVPKHNHKHNHNEQ